eukprot:12120-Heterococcus_DN1.PRE.2
MGPEACYCMLKQANGCAAAAVECASILLNSAGIRPCASRGSGHECFMSAVTTDKHCMTRLLRECNAYTAASAASCSAMSTPSAALLQKRADHSAVWDTC